MKNIITYNQFINESIKDLMKGKSDEEILKKLGDLNLEELLKKSLQNGYLNGVKLALEKGANPSDKDNEAIRFASEEGHTEIVELLLQDKRVNPSDKDNEAIRYASENGYTEIVELLLQDKRIDPSDDDNYAIKNASYNGFTEIVRLLLQDKRVRNKLSDREIEKYENQKRGLKESVRDLMKPKSEEEISKKIGDLNPNDLLMKSINNNYLNGVKLALEKGADLSANDNYAIKYASLDGYTEIVKLLLQDERVDPSADNRNDAIRYASMNGHTEIVKLLLQDKRVDPSNKKNLAIGFASYYGHTEVVKLLLQDKRVDPSDDDNYAIKNASYNGFTEIVRLLLQDKRVREKLTDKEIKEYENQISELNESIRDLMKPKSKEEINNTIKELIKTNPERILRQYDFDFLLTIISKEELHDAVINFFKRNPEHVLKNWNYKKLFTIISKEELHNTINESFVMSLGHYINGNNSDESAINITNIIIYLWENDYIYDSYDNTNDLWFKHKTRDKYKGGYICINGYTTMDYIKDYIKRSEELSKRYK